MLIPADTLFTIGFTQLPPGVGSLDPREGERATAPFNGEPISLRPPSAQETQVWKLVEDPNPDPGQESYTIVHVNPSSPNPGTEELGFCSLSNESGAPIILASPTCFVLKKTEYTTSGNTLIVTMHPKGLKSNNHYVTPSQEGTLEVQEIDVTTGQWPAWGITPAGIPFS
ncbi:hypothetical protein RhiLY_08313 [Ceratobasidium sp. AG-Ba]|nr:hypothetical protein RhiLY_08313 [Ceratobasidium sp. AG-Ba]